MRLWIALACVCVTSACLPLRTYYAEGVSFATLARDTNTKNTQSRSPVEMRLERRAARNKRARRWARVSPYALGICCLTAIWQDRALAPAVHDGMIVVADATTTFIYESENSGFATAMSNFSGVGGLDASQFDPITDALLRMQN